jgi:regulator of sirC expression with transglutaminase-like and TPR domain
MSLPSPDPMHLPDPTHLGDESLAAFAAAVAGDEARVDLARAALLVAAADRPGLDVGHYLTRLDTLAHQASRELELCSDPVERVGQLCHYLFEDLGLRGNAAAYYDARNSYLDQVLDRGLGIPITLAVILLEVAWRLDLDLEGVDFPGHFLVRLPARRPGEQAVLLDPFHGGGVVDRWGCQVLLDRASGGQLQLQPPQHLRTATKRGILARMLRNLKGVHLREGHLDQALAAVERLLVVQPDHPQERRDRGLLYLTLGRFARAADDLARYLGALPQAPDHEQVRERLAEARRRQWELN